MPDLGIDKLGPFPILQIVGAIIILSGLALAVYRGTRDRRLSIDQLPQPSSTRWYFDGPLKASLDSLHDQYKVLCSIDNEIERIGEEFRNHTRLLDEIRNELRESNARGRRR
jgi:hypothetical protein